MEVNRRIGKAVAYEQTWEELDRVQPITRDTPIILNPLQDENQWLRKEIARLREENKSLKLMLAKKPLPSQEQIPTPPYDRWNP